MAGHINTKILIISDTHGASLPQPPQEQVDIVIHCGDLTDKSELSEYRTTLALMKTIPAKLKLAIPGNHDFTLEDSTFADMVRDLRSREEVSDDLVHSIYGRIGEARALFDAPDMRAAGIVLLTRGTHVFCLDNGAKISVYADPFTQGVGAFQFEHDEQYDWEISQDVDIVITHGPPLGILDRTVEKTRAGSRKLFSKIALTQPRLHCFGHIHGAWEAREVAWREEYIGELSHFTAIDNNNSHTEATLHTANGASLYHYIRQPSAKAQTLFVNAAIQGQDDKKQGIWMVELPMPRAQAERGVDHSSTYTSNV